MNPSITAVYQCSTEYTEMRIVVRNCENYISYNEREAAGELQNDERNINISLFFSDRKEHE